MSKKKKAALISLGVLLFILCVSGVKGIAFASGLTGEETGNYLFNKYPIKNYRPDSYVDTSGDWLPWNWGKGLDDGMYSVISYLVGTVYVAIFTFFDIIGYLVQAVYSTDVIEPLLDTAVNFIQSVSGFNGRFLQNGLFTQFLAVVVIITGLYYGFMLIGKETGKTISGMAAFCMLVVVSLGFFWKADTFITGANEIANSVQSVVVKAGTSALGMDGDPAVAIREGFFDITVYQPYLLLQYNDNTVSRERAERILSLESGSEEREKLVKEEVEEKGNEMMSGWTALDHRMSNLLPLVLSSIVLAVIILFMVGINIYHQFLFLIYCCFSPFILIFSLLPGRSQMAVRLGGKILYELCMRVSLAMLLCLMYGFSSAIYTITGTEGYMVGAVLQAIVYIVIFVFRKKIYGFFMSEKKPGRSGGLKSAIGTFYMANRGMKALNAITGNKPGLAGRRKSGGNTGAGGGSSAASKNPSGGRVGGVPGAPGGNNSGGSYGAYASRKKNGGNASKQLGGARKPAGNRLPTRKRSANSRYRPVAPVGGVNARFSGDVSRYKRSGGADGRASRPGMDGNRQRLPMRGGKYHPARREQMPRVRSAKWNTGSQPQVERGGVKAAKGTDYVSGENRYAQRDVVSGQPKDNNANGMPLVKRAGVNKSQPEKRGHSRRRNNVRNSKKNKK